MFLQVSYHMVCKIVTHVQILDLAILAEFFEYVFIKILNHIK